nr:MAG TPA: periplasmic nitrate reductase [Caudoviricetes sp.]
MIFLVFCIFPTLTVFSIFVTFFAIQSYYIIIP